MRLPLLSPTEQQSWSSVAQQSVARPLQSVDSMLTLVELGPNILGYHVDGKLDTADVERVFQEVDRTLATSDRIRVYAEVHSLSGLTLNAVWTDLRLTADHLKSISRIEKAALVTDIGWLRTAAGLENRMFGNIQIRVFSIGEQMEARNWITS